MNKDKSLETQNQNKYDKKIELRILLIGEEGVGKKSITKRFKILNSSETKSSNMNHKTILFNKKHKSKTKIKTEKDPITKNNEQIPQKYKSEKELISEEEKKIQNMKNENRKKLRNFTKIFKICGSTVDSIELSIFPCIEAEPLPYDFDPGDEEEANFETQNKISLVKLINEISEILCKIPNNPNNKVEIIFFLCFDLSNFESFEKIVLYFSQLNQHFQFNSGYYNCILIGNKLDKKINDIGFHEAILKFITKTNMRYYEISTYMFFNFENFFEKLFYELYGNQPQFLDPSFKRKFHQILSEKSNFLQSIRKTYPDNFNPSPDKYKNNPYEYPSKKREFFKIFHEKDKFNKHIFINKNGPMFPPIIKKNKNDEFTISTSFIKDDEEINDKEKNKNSTIDVFAKEYNITQVNIKANPKHTYTCFSPDIRQKIKDSLEINSKKPGYTLGVYTNNPLGLRQSRRNLNLKRSIKITNAFDNGVRVNIKFPQSFRGIINQKKYALTRQNIFQKKKEENKKISEDIKMRHKKNNTMNSTLFKEKVNTLLAKEKKYLKKYENKQKRIEHSRKKSVILSYLHSIKHKNDEPKAKFYSPQNYYINNKKGFTFGQKLEQKQLINSPQFPDFTDDFEKIVQKNKNCKKIIGSNRFKDIKSYLVGDSSSVMEKQKLYELKRLNFRKNEMSEFFEDRKSKTNNVYKNKKKLIRNEKKELKQQIQKLYKTSNDYFSRIINYSQVEESSPQYTIKGKCNYHIKSDSSDNILTNFNAFLTQVKISSRNKKNFENSDISIVKPSFPAFSFGNAERFNLTTDYYHNKSLDKKIFNDSSYNSTESILFKDGVFGNRDTKSFLVTQTTMGTEKKFRNYKDNGVPGPGNYTISSFAEEIIKKGKQKQKFIKRKEMNKNGGNNDINIEIGLGEKKENSNELYLVDGKEVNKNNENDGNIDEGEN